MMKCNYCNCDMIENCRIDVSHSFNVDVGNSISMTVFVPNGKDTSIFGLPITGGDQYRIKAEVCPQCGKIELFADK